MLTALSHEYHSQKGAPLEIVSHWPMLIEGNPTAVVSREWTGAITFPECHDQAAIKEHNVRFMCRKLGLVPPQPETIRPHLYLSDFELRDNFIPYPYLTIHPGTGPWTPNKTWHLWSGLVEEILIQFPGINIVQLGGAGEPRLPMVHFHFPDLPLRQVAALLHNARLHLSCVTGTMHIATAVECKCVCIFGGREDPAITGYSMNVNLQSQAPQGCAPCWLVSPCPHGRWADLETGMAYREANQSDFVKPCMEQIAVGTVIEAMRSTGKL